MFVGLTSDAKPAALTRRWRSPRDRSLLAICGLGFLLGCYGIWWGWVECWNPDQMALVRLRHDGLLPAPEWQLKPPFHTYLNYALVLLPFRVVRKLCWIFTGSRPDVQVLILYSSRLLQLLLFVGCVYLCYRIAQRALGRDTGRQLALLTATSAGFVLQAHFLTADIPVTFWMLLSFYCAQSIAITGRLRAYLLAGLMTGVATATKYNGLAVGLAIPLFHWLGHPEQPLLRLAFDRRLVLGVSAVLVGFVLANPYSVLNWRGFAEDFYYNYVTTPVYEGQNPDENGYGLFALRIPEIVGWPLAVGVVLATAGTLAGARRLDRLQRATIGAAAGVFLLYFYKFGGMPRVEVRFVLPAVPFLFIAAAPGMMWFYRGHRVLARASLAAVALYGAIASVWVGYRFAHDPRMSAQAWVAGNVARGATIESTYYSPRWNRYPGIDVTDSRMPGIFGRRHRIAEQLPAGSRIRQMVEERESETGMEWFAEGALDRRRPDYVALNSLYYDRFLTPDGEQAYPAIASYVRRLLAGELGYRIAFDRSAGTSPAWLYPQEIVFVDNRMVLLERLSPAPALP